MHGHREFCRAGVWKTVLSIVSLPAHLTRLDASPEKTSNAEFTLLFLRSRRHNRESFPLAARLGLD
jgi:hypothetical protein